jgi:MFS family permease
MDTQNTPIHIRLWHREFWMLALANMLLCMAVYMLIPVLPNWMISIYHLTHWQISLAFASYGVGLFILGGFCNSLVQRFRRNRVCLVGIGIIAALLYLLNYIPTLTGFSVFSISWVSCALLGAVFGLVQMILSSTLIIDVCDSFLRTEANHASSWFGRLALSLGPVAGLAISEYMNMRSYIIASVILCVLAFLLILSVKFRFKAPDEAVSLFSFDRFFLVQGKWLFINLVMVTTVIGILFSIEHDFIFYGMLFVGFLFAILAQKYVFVNADLKSEIITGLLFIIIALLLMLTRHQVSVNYLTPTFVGVGIGLVESRFQLFFVKLSRHCQRGTSQSTYFLATELGLAIGLTLGWSCLYSDDRIALIVCLGIILLSLIFYNLFTHRWYMQNKNR